MKVTIFTDKIFKLIGVFIAVLCLTLSLTSSAFCQALPLDLPGDLPQDIQESSKQKTIPAKRPNPSEKRSGKESLNPQLAPQLVSPSVPSLLGVLVIDDKGEISTIDRSNSSFVNDENLITDWADIVNRAVLKNLTKEQQKALFSDINRLTSSKYAVDIFIPKQILFIKDHNQASGQYHGMCADLRKGTMSKLTSPDKLTKNQAYDFLIEYSLKGKTPLLVPAVANKDSKLYHKPNASHFVESEDTVLFEDGSLAEKAGFRPCTICYPHESRYLSSDSRDRQMSSQGARAIENRYRLSQNEEDIRKVREIGDSLLKANPNLDRESQFVVLESDEFNAFSVHNGPVYITSGLLHILDTDDELAAVLSHELAHIALKHSRSLSTRKKITNALGMVMRYSTGSYLAGVGTKAVGNFVNKGFSREQEFEADREAVLMSYTAGYDPKDFALTIIKTLEATQQLGGGTIGPDWFRTHPNEQSRIQEINKIAQDLKPFDNKIKVIVDRKDPSLAAYLKSKVRDYLSNKAVFDSFLDAYNALSLPN